MDYRLEVIGLPVSDVDVAKEFYVNRAGFHLDHDIAPSTGMRVVQMTPPGSACSVVIWVGLLLGEPGSVKGVQLVVEDIDGAPMILRNRGIPGRHWVSFELAGTKSNRLGIGARVKLVADGMTQTDQVRSGGSYLYQNDLRVHFGLADAKKIDSVEIRWPSGKLETLTNLTPDKFYSVLEGKGIVPAEQIRPQPSTNP